MSGIDSVVLRLSPDPMAVHGARSLLRQAAAMWQLSGCVDAAELVLSELLTNALRHATGPTEVVLRPRERGMLVEVRDGDSTQPAPPGQAPPDSEGGRGMWIVDAASERWGVDPQPDGKTVWALVEPEQQDHEL